MYTCHTVVLSIKLCLHGNTLQISSYFGHKETFEV